MRMLRTADRPFSTFGAGDGSVHALRERCGLVLREIQPEAADREDGGDYFITVEKGTVGKIDLCPEPSGGTAPVEQIVMRLHPGLTIPQAQKLYAVADWQSLLGLRDRGWQVKPHLMFRYQGTPKYTPAVLAEEVKYFEFWKRNPDMIKGNLNRAIAAGEWWDRCVQGGILSPGDAEGLLRAFSEKRKVNPCPGWTVVYSWTLNNAVTKDAKGEFVEAVRERISEVLQAINQGL